MTMKKEESTARAAVRKSRIGAGETVYPYTFNETKSREDIPKFGQSMDIRKDKYNEREESLIEIKISMGGRVLEIRQVGRICFIKIESKGESMQIIYREKVKQIYRGDIIGVYGLIGYSAKGELSIIADSVTVLSPCLHTYPTE